MTPIFVWKKGTLATYNKVTENFSLDEFECSCNHSSCVQQFMSVPFITQLQGLRNIAGIPIKMRSAFRCTHYQNFLRTAKKPDGTLRFKTAKKLSQHELGNAGDIECDDMDALTVLASDYFKAIGNGRTWMHVDGRVDKIRRWGY